MKIRTEIPQATRELLNRAAKNIAEKESMKRHNYNIYVASSWRNEKQPALIKWLRSLRLGEVYDFRHPGDGTHGFKWEEVDLRWAEWTPADYRSALESEPAEDGFARDFEAMQKSGICILLLPCGASAHLEAGWFVGNGRPLYIVLDETDFRLDLMYKMANEIYATIEEFQKHFCADLIRHSDE